MLFRCQKDPHTADSYRVATVCLNHLSSIGRYYRSDKRRRLHRNLLQVLTHQGVFSLICFLRHLFDSSIGGLPSDAPFLWYHFDQLFPSTVKYATGVSLTRTRNGKQLALLLVNMDRFKNDQPSSDLDKFRGRVLLDF